MNKVIIWFLISVIKVNKFKAQNKPNSVRTGIYLKSLFDFFIPLFLWILLNNPRKIVFINMR